MLLTMRLESGEFTPLAEAYAQRWSLPVCAATLDGRIQHGDPDLFAGMKAQDLVEHLVAECLRWGDPAIAEQPGGLFFWGVPVMHNSAVEGLIAVRCREDQVFPDQSGKPAIDLKAASVHLRHLAEEANLTNAALLKELRGTYRLEQEKAYLLHDSSKASRSASMHEAYMREEPHLMSAIHLGDRSQAIHILNRILLVVYNHGGDELDLIKSFLMELVASMCRAAVEAGGQAKDLLGVNYKALTALADVDGEEGLSSWLVAMLNRIMDVIAATSRRPASSVMQAGISYMEEHFDEPLSRDQVAKVAGVSPSHFSRLLTAKTGRGFSDLLNQIRVDRAATMLRCTDKSLVQIALETGFSDQSYFTKVFRRHTESTPREYRNKHRR